MRVVEALVVRHVTEGIGETDLSDVETDVDGARGRPHRTSSAALSSAATLVTSADFAVA